MCIQNIICALKFLLGLTAVFGSSGSFVDYFSNDINFWRKDMVYQLQFFHKILQRKGKFSVSFSSVT